MATFLTPTDAHIVLSEGTQLVANPHGKLRALTLRSPVQTRPCYFEGSLLFATEDGGFWSVSPDLSEAPTLLHPALHLLGLASDGVRVLALRKSAGPLDLVELDPAAPGSAKTLSVAEPTRIAWPWAPQQAARAVPGVEVFPTITGNAHGVVVASASGLVCVLRPDGAIQSWRSPAVSGVTTGYAYKEGVCVTTSYFGSNSQDVVWLDNEGLWRDGNTQGGFPVRPVGGYFFGAERLGAGRGVMTQYGPEPARRRAVAQWEVPPPLAIAGDVSMSRLAIAIEAPSGTSVGVWTADNGLRPAPGWSAAPWEEVAHEVFQRELPMAYPAWRYELREDPDLGPLPVVDEAQLEELLAPSGTDVEMIPNLVPLFGRYTGKLEGLKDYALSRLLRVPPFDPTYSSLTRVLERLHDKADTPFIMAALRYAVPEPIRALPLTMPADEWLARKLVHVHPETTVKIRGRMFENPVVEVVGDLRRWPAWRIVARDPLGTAELPVETLLPFHVFRPPTPTSRIPLGLTKPGTVTPISYACLIGVNCAKTETDVFVVSSVGPVIVADAHAPHAEALKRAGYYAALSLPHEQQLYLGRWDGHWAASHDRGLLETPEAVLSFVDDRSPTILQELSDGMVDFVDVDTMGGGLREQISVACFCPTTLEHAAEALESVLLNHPNIEELYASTEELSGVIARHRS